MSAVLEEVERADRREKVLESARARKAERDYAALVVLLSEEGEADAEEVLAQVAAAGKTVEQLKDAVAFRVARLNAAELLTGMPAAEGRVTGAQRAVAKLEADRKAALAKFDEQIRQAKAAHKQAVADLDPFHAARDHLERTAPADLKSEHAAVISRAGDCRRRLVELAGEIATARDRLDKGQIFANVGHAGYAPELKHYYTPAERAALTTDRFEWMNVERYASELVARTGDDWNAWLDAAAARGERPGDVHDRGRVVAAEKERRRREIVATWRREAQHDLDTMRAEESALRRELEELDRAERDAIARMLVP